MNESVGSKRFVVVATYNEALNLRDLVSAIGQAVPGATLLVVDDNSPDGSPALLAEIAAANNFLVPVIRQTKDGYGGAMLEGFRRALTMGATEVATLDADFSHDPAALPMIFEALNKAVVAIGSRYAGGVRVLNWHPSRLLLSLFANRYVKGILNLPADDATSGFRGYRRSALERLMETEVRSKGYSFLVEVLYRLHKANCRVKEVPIIYTERREGQSKMTGGVIWEAVFRPWLLKFFGR